MGRGKAVIAKRCRRTIAAVERIIYEEVLPHLPIASLRYYGFIEDANDAFCWLFLEDTCGVPYSPQIAEHRACAARWLGLMHTSTAKITAALQLPNRGPDHYLAHLKSGRSTIQQNLGNPALTGDDLALLASIIQQCNRLASHWDQIEQFCFAMPDTLVHGDFFSKNVHIRNGWDGLELLPFDWELAGWGVPAIDLVQLDMTTYRAVVQAVWPGLDGQTLQQLTDIGQTFRYLAAIDWESEGLAYRWVEKPLRNMQVCQSWLADIDLL
ncbi:aminoglycoside phosphotransferase family protein [Chloroflexi bacterium TSY]|nr:aminoglycoside phosphotransferase family protein [Chloroflexi bacterium TSY]